MPELWEVCNAESLATLIQLYWNENGCYPEFYYILSGQRQRKPVIMSPDVEEDHLAEVNKEMSLPPTNRRNGIDG